MKKQEELAQKLVDFLKEHEITPIGKWEPLNALGAGVIQEAEKNKNYEIYKIKDAGTIYQFDYDNGRWMQVTDSPEQAINQMNVRKEEVAMND